jgi:hypothetical protein
VLILYLLQSPPYCIVIIRIKGVQIRPDCAFKQHGVLWDDSDSRTEVVGTNERNVLPINGDISLCAFHHSKQC